MVSKKPANAPAARRWCLCTRAARVCPRLQGLCAAIGLMLLADATAPSQPEPSQPTAAGEQGDQAGRLKRQRKPPAKLADAAADSDVEEEAAGAPPPKRRRQQKQEPSPPLLSTQRSDDALSAPPPVPTPSRSRSSRTVSSVAVLYTELCSSSGSGASTSTSVPHPLPNDQEFGSSQAADGGAAHPAPAPSIAAAIARKTPTKSMLSIMELLMSIEAGGPIPESDIRKGLKDSPDISKALRELVKAGRVRKTGRGGRGHHKFHYAVTRQ